MDPGDSRLNPISGWAPVSTLEAAARMAVCATAITPEWWAGGDTPQRKNIFRFSEKRSVKPGWAERQWARSKD